MVASLLYVRVLPEKTMAFVWGEPTNPGSRTPKWKFCSVIWQCTRKKKISAFSLCLLSSHTTTTPTTLLMPDVWGFLSQTLLWDMCWVSFNLIQFRCYLPGDRVRFHRLRAQSYKTAPTPLQMPITKDAPNLTWLQIIFPQPPAQF